MLRGFFRIDASALAAAHMAAHVAASIAAPIAARTTASAALLAAIVLSADPAAAHEYWLDPLASELEIGEPVQADVRNGENYLGNRFPFDPGRFTRAELVGRRGALPIDGRLGDLPALVIRAPVPGLFWLALETTVRPLEYDSAADFQAFVDFHGLASVVEAFGGESEATVSGEAGPLERYSRHALSAIQVAAPGEAPTTDREMPEAPELDYALVPIADPFVGQSVTLEARFEGEPVVDVQVERFVRSGNAGVERSVARTDANGRVTFALQDGADHLFNSVRMRPADDPTAGWRTWWASLTIER